MGVQEVLAQQAALYGEPLGARFGRLLEVYGIPQSRLAAVIGLSAPMLSQLASGQRVKITNPAVYARLLRLEDLARQTSDPQALRAALAQVAGSQPTLTTEPAAAAGHGDDRGRAIAYLSRIAPPDELAGAAAAAHGRLAEVLRLAAEASSR